MRVSCCVLLLLPALRVYNGGVVPCFETSGMDGSLTCMPPWMTGTVYGGWSQFHRLTKLAVVLAYR